MEKRQLYQVAITAIIVKEGKYLITRRSPSKSRFPGMWTVPGGHLETSDYANTAKETEFYWYNVLEKALRREVLEEVGLQINKIVYVTSMATGEGESSQSLVISCMADYESGEVMLQEEETDSYAWVSLEEAKEYELIDGIYDELVMADKVRRGDGGEWKRG